MSSSFFLVKLMMEYSNSDSDSSEDEALDARAREIRAAWRSKWTRGRRKRPQSIDTSRDDEAHFLVTPTQFALSPVAAISAPARSTRIQRNHQLKRRETSPRGVDQRLDYYYEKRAALKKDDEALDALRRELMQESPPQAQSFQELRHSTTWPRFSPPRPAAPRRKQKKKTQEPKTIISSLFFCCSQDTTGERAS